MNPLWEWYADDRAMIDASLSLPGWRTNKRWRANKQVKNKPFFLVYLPAAPHHPYVVPDESFEVIKPEIPGSGEDQPSSWTRWTRYQNAVHYADFVLGYLVNGLEKRGLMENTLLFIFADHGEAFFQHSGNYLHALYIYEENVHVPFIIYNKELFPERYDYPGISRHIDIVPTVLDALGISSDAEYEGISLLSAHKQQLAHFHTQWTKDFIGLRDGPWKYILRMTDQREELYNLNKDPGEKKNLAEAGKKLSRLFKKTVIPCQRI